jgi:hypothetical protein
MKAVTIFIAIFLLVGTAFACSATTNDTPSGGISGGVVSGGSKNSAPCIEITPISDSNFKLVNGKNVTFSYKVVVTDDNGIDTLDNIQLYYQGPSPSTTKKDSIVLTLKEILGFDGTIIDNCTYEFEVDSKTPITSTGTYYFYGVVQDANGGSDSDSYNIKVSETDGLFTVSNIAFSYVKPKETSTATFTIKNVAGSPCVIKSITFADLKIGTDSIPSSLMNVTFPTTTLKVGETATIKASYVVPAGTQVGALTGKCIITLEDV